MERDALFRMNDISQAVVAVVDDDPRILESLESLLEAAGLNARVFSLAEDFLNGDHLSLTSCLVTDVRMAGISGLDLQRRVRRERPQLPVIFVTAHHDEEVKRRALEEGAAFLFYKPFDADELLQAIKLALIKPTGGNRKVL
jgi:FixJ family two-component response regulator